MNFERITSLAIIASAALIWQKELMELWQWVSQPIVKGFKPVAKVPSFKTLSSVNTQGIPTDSQFADSPVANA